FEQALTRCFAHSVAPQSCAQARCGQSRACNPISIRAMIADSMTTCSRVAVGQLDRVDDAMAGDHCERSMLRRGLKTLAGLSNRRRPGARSGARGASATASVRAAPNRIITGREAIHMTGKSPMLRLARAVLE